jgi:hypothetical protein
LTRSDLCAWSELETETWRDSRATIVWSSTLVSAMPGFSVPPEIFDTHLTQTSMPSSRLLAFPQVSVLTVSQARVSDIRYFRYP